MGEGIERELSLVGDVEQTTQQQKPVVLQSKNFEVVIPSGVDGIVSPTRSCCRSKRISRALGMMLRP